MSAVMILMDLLISICWSNLGWEAFSVVAATKDSNLRTIAREIDSHTEKVEAAALSGRRSLLFGALLWVQALCLLLLAGGQAAAADLVVPLKSIAQITVNDDGQALNFPSAVFFDPVEKEIYVTDGGIARVVVYGPDFFPLVSMGSGRGVAAPRGGFVLSNGEVYICQVRNVKNPRPRITILNGAFLIDREIFLDEIQEAGDFKPNQLAVSRDGTIYLAGLSSRGLLVLDKEGKFLRWLQPLDETTSPGAFEEEKKPPSDQTENQDEEGEQPPSDEAEKKDSKEISAVNIPEEFRPRSSAVKGGTQKGIGRVRINHVTIDNSGRLYLVSQETSKIYVYGPDETFLFSFGKKGGTARHMSQPNSLVIDEKRGLIFVSDYMRHSILVHDMSGKYLFEFGGRGVAPGWFNYPSGLAINTQGQLIVADLYNKRVQVLEVGYDEVFRALKIEVPAGDSPEKPVAVDSTEQDALVPGKPDSGGVQEIAPEAPPPSGQPDSEGHIEQKLDVPK